MLKIIPIKALKDNYIWCLIDTNTQNCVIVDPGEATPVFQTLNQLKLNLAAILVTHHHWDHTQGIPELVDQFDVPVYGSHVSSNPHISIHLEDQDSFSLLNRFHFKAIAVPGHTLDHMAYYGEGSLFSGDTLFSAGCGKIFEGSAAQMYHSLLQLKKLSDQTQLYCGHEYTLQNLAFANTIEPNNKAIITYLNSVKELQTNNQPTLPSTMGLEKKVNPFLRSEYLDVITAVSQYAEQDLKHPEEVFRHTRLWKNEFKTS